MCPPHPCAALAAGTRPDPGVGRALARAGGARARAHGTLDGATLSLGARARLYSVQSTVTRTALRLSIVS